MISRSSLWVSRNLAVGGRGKRSARWPNRPRAAAKRDTQYSATHRTDLYGAPPLPDVPPAGSCAESVLSLRSRTDTPNARAWSFYVRKGHRAGVGKDPPSPPVWVSTGRVVHHPDCRAKQLVTFGNGTYIRRAWRSIRTFVRLRRRAPPPHWILDLLRTQAPRI